MKALETPDGWWESLDPVTPEQLDADQRQLIDGMVRGVLPSRYAANVALRSGRSYRWHGNEPEAHGATMRQATFDRQLRGIVIGLAVFDLALYAGLIFR
jgi:hypothetical protein